MSLKAPQREENKVILGVVISKSKLLLKKFPSSESLDRIFPLLVPHSLQGS